MGANLLILAAVALQSPPPDSTPLSLTHGIAFERLPDLLLYNRVQGLSFGLGYRVGRARPGFTGLLGTLRYGLSDDRVTGRLTFVRGSRNGQVTLSGYADVDGVDAFSSGHSFANTLNGLLAGHDNGDYARVAGSTARLITSIGRGLDLIVTARVERQRSVSSGAQSELNDFLGGTGVFPPNPPVYEGTFAGTSVSLTHVGGTRWNVTGDVLGGAGQTTARLFGDIRRAFGSVLGMTVRLKGGVATEPTLPQTAFRLGGLNTVRGFEYAALRAPAFWAAQVDVSAFEGRVRPVIFVDMGQASRISSLLSSSVLVGGGIGLSLFRGFLRFDLSRPISPDAGSKLRFDLVIQGAR